MGKTLKVELTVKEDDGRVIVKTLYGEDADKWQRLVADLCLFAQVHNRNPDWASLQWRKTEAWQVSESGLDKAEYRLILEACSNLPKASGNYHVNDFITNLMSTVLDKQLNPTTVSNIENHYKSKRYDEIRTHDDLVAFFHKYPNTREGNTEAALYLWGYKYWNRMEQLRQLVAYFDSIEVSDEESLERWAKNSDFHKHFEGRIKGLGIAAYQWLTMRKGVQTVKPDSRVKRFLRKATGRDFSDKEIILVLEKVAAELGIPANELDWAIWESEGASH
ncbi:MAG TPA: hypothetical protein VGC66_02070 [Pyrinomonadaceae bacterium]|jgi:hypothetical protein